MVIIIGVLAIYLTYICARWIGIKKDTKGYWTIGLRRLGIPKLSKIAELFSKALYGLNKESLGKNILCRVEPNPYHSDRLGGS